MTCFLSIPPPPKIYSDFSKGPNHLILLETQKQIPKQDMVVENLKGQVRRSEVGTRGLEDWKSTSRYRW